VKDLYSGNYKTLLKVMKEDINKPGMEIHACNPAIQEAETGRSLV
jgi:hypothetical protein